MHKTIQDLRLTRQFFPYGFLWRAVRDAIADDDSFQIKYIETTMRMSEKISQIIRRSVLADNMFINDSGNSKQSSENPFHCLI